MEDPPLVASPFTYRPEIDGLRAVAVLAVVLFHAQLGCPGGFVGVDVFFVISGFLISSIILRDLDSSSFRLIDFWERRVRRIVPALTVWVAATLVAGWFLYPPEEYQRLGQAVVAQGLILSNLFHATQINYFTPATEGFALLHTWSLAVEEQFYLVLPLVLVAIRRWWPGGLRRLMVLACLLSFILGIWATKRWPQYAYWILPTRAWELLLGGLLAANPHLGSAAKRGVREVVSWGGLTAILLSIGLYDDSVPFPGFAALVPTVGAVAFLWANATETTNAGRILAWSPIAFVGKASYSFYLIHWPAIAFANYWLMGEMTWLLRLGLMLAAFPVAVLSLHLVEIPVRKRFVLATRRSLFVAAFVANALLLGAGYVVHWNQGFPSRFDAQTLRYLPPSRETVYAITELDYPAVESGRLSEFGVHNGPATCLVWGDSHAMALIPVLDDLCREHGLRGSAAMHSNTAPLLEFKNPNGGGIGEDAPRFNAAVVNVAIKRQVRFVVIAAAWFLYADDPSFGTQLEHTVDRLTTAGIDVVLVRDVPHHTDDIPRLLLRAKSRGEDVRTVGIAVELHREKNRVADKWLEKRAGPRVIVLDPTEYLIDETGLCRGELDGVAMYRDGSHLSTAGARRLKPLFEPVFVNESRRPPRDASPP